MIITRRRTSQYSFYDIFLYTLSLSLSLSLSPSSFSLALSFALFLLSILSFSHCPLVGFSPSLSFVVHSRYLAHSLFSFRRPFDIDVVNLRYYSFLFFSGNHYQQQGGTPIFGRFLLQHVDSLALLASPTFLLPLLFLVLYKLFVVVVRSSYRFTLEAVILLLLNRSYSFFPFS